MFPAAQSGGLGDDRVVQEGALVAGRDSLIGAMASASRKENPRTTKRAAPGPKRCVVCEQLKQVANCLAAGGYVCRACYRKNFAPREACGICGRVGIVNARPDGVAHCETCYKRHINRESCSFCGSVRTVHARDAARKPVCLDCYEKHMGPREPCLYCEKQVPPAYRGPSGEAICRNCYHGELKRAVCTDCGHDAPLAGRTKAGDPLCGHCLHKSRTPETCPCCREERPLKTCRDGERICERCWRVHKQPRYPCSQCTGVAVVAKWLSDTRPICRRCYDRAP